MTAGPGAAEAPPRIVTARLIPRAAEAGDAAALNAAIRETYDDLRRWLPWAARGVPAPGDTERFLREAAERRRDGRDRVYLLLPGDRPEREALLGVCNLHLGDPDVPAFEIGYWCRKGAQGRGYVTEAVRALTALAFDRLGAERVQIRCDARNERSTRVALRAGYAREARLARARRSAFDGRLSDLLVFARLRD